ncbi:Uncharacterized conserved protein, DUF2141 family [Salegentibacter echinorum]|uniref:Uncharacterized conserved protein, DUF2141 family n=1 Tax=Salegentibacter echinorum TaxID=1073325 RepID=A0A1M5CNX0_SALEC|nr:DUF2141 domain-containing protein [Salegentibacter echinorum]SHF56455.1 Uncharacterized conserved protein, DUF2141 family [Salegentibacter echinorum]
MKIIAIIFSLFVSQVILAQETETGDITVQAKNFTKDEGKVYFGLYTEENFIKSAPLKGEVSEIKDGIAKVTFKDVPAGTYAISSYHDKNGNKRLDFDENGIPTEDYGVSNNAMNLYGPPIWDEAKFKFDGGAKKLELIF